MLIGHTHVFLCFFLTLSIMEAIFLDILNSTNLYEG